MINMPPHRGFENIGFVRKRDKHNELEEHDGDMLHEYLIFEQEKDPCFTFQISTDDEGRIRRCFWADATSRRAYKYYSDVVMFDTTYNTNRYGLIFATLLGVNNHGQTIVFGCAFLGDETVDSFVWFLNRFLKAMYVGAPKVIITDHDPAVTRAISEVLPHTYHRYCSWHILTKFSEKIDSVKLSAYYNEFSDCVWKSEVKEEFDCKWMDILDRSGLNDNKWLCSMYDIRSKWVPAYVNHVFSANMSSIQRADCANAFLKKYVSKKNSFVDFMIQFESGLVRQRNEELFAYHKELTEKPKIKLPAYVLVQMVGIYTHEIFYKFQDEMWESLTFKFEVVKEEENHVVYKIRRKNDDTQKVREILYNKNLQFASCSCKMFESSGVPCRHMLAYLQKFHDFDKLPSQYILKRWTKTAKTNTIIGASGIEITDDKSYFLQRRQLIQMSLDVIDKALTSPEAIKIFTDALDNALAKINQVVGFGSDELIKVKTSNPTFGGTSGSVSVNMSSNYEHVYKEPQQVKAKGHGKRLKGGKEKALDRAKKSKGRRCNGCGMVGQSHDKRNCPN